MGNLITRQCKILLESKQHAIIYAIVFSILPLASWISVTLVCLVTLRKGGKSGFDVMLPALVIHSVPLMMLIPISSALINALISYLPCYLAALSLRKSEKWQIVFGVFAIQIFMGCLLIQLLTPDVIVEQFNQLKMIMTQYQELVDSNFNGMSSSNLAQIFFGVQILTFCISGFISLMFARAIQSKLFLPGGFKNELMTFRSGRLSLIVFAAVFLLSYYEVPLTINMLPIMFCYFLLSGLSLIYFICSRKRQPKFFILFVLIILLRPFFVLSAYIVIGLLDSLFNFRSYLPTGARESI